MDPLLDLPQLMIQERQREADRSRLAALARAARECCRTSRSLLDRLQGRPAACPASGVGCRP